MAATTRTISEHKTRKSATKALDKLLRLRRDAQHGDLDAAAKLDKQGVSVSRERLVINEGHGVCTIDAIPINTDRA